MIHARERKHRAVFVGVEGNGENFVGVSAKKEDTSKLTEIVAYNNYGYITTVITC